MKQFFGYSKKAEQEDKIDSRKTLKIYLACLKPSWKYIILAFIFLAMDATFEMLIPYFSGLFISQGLEGYGAMVGSQPQPIIAGQGFNQPAMNQIWLYGGLIIGLAFLAIFCQCYAMKVAAKISSDFVERLRNTLFWKMEEFSFSNIGHFPVSKLTTMLSNDCNNVRFFVLMCLRAGFKSPLMILIGFILIFSQNWLIGLIALPFSVISFIFMCYLIRKTKPQFIQTQKSIDNVNCNVEEDTEGIREVKAFCREDLMANKFGKANQELTNVSYVAFARMAIVTAITQFAVNITVGVIQLVGGFDMIYTMQDSSLWLMFNNGKIFDAGELSMLSNFAASLTMAFSFLGMLLQIFGRAEASKERIDRVLCEKIDISYTPKEKTKDFDPDKIATGDIEFKDVCFTYVNDLNKLALGPINLKIKSGTTLGIIGGTGSGKSTLVNLIPRLYDVSKGEILIANHDVKDYSLQALRNDIGVVLQNNLLFTGTIKSNILWGKKDASDDEIWDALELAQAKDFVNRFNEKLETSVNQGGKSVSGGQKQRLCIARAVIKKPKILILDDSTSACDMKTARLIHQGLATKLKETTTLLISQRISSVKNCDQILVLDNGKIVGLGKHEDLLKNCEIYKEINEIQAKGVE